MTHKAHTDNVLNRKWNMGKRQKEGIWKQVEDVNRPRSWRTEFCRVKMRNEMKGWRHSVLTRRVLPFLGLNSACLNTTVATAFLNRQYHLQSCISQFNILLRSFVPSLWVCYIRRAQVKVGLINLCKSLFSLNAHIYYSIAHRQAVCNLPGGYSTILPHKAVHCSNW
jgi:hypothetical protein